MEKRLWSAVRSVACFALCLGVFYLCFLLSGVGAYAAVCLVAALTLLVIVFANWLFDEWILMWEDMEEDD